MNVFLFWQQRSTEELDRTPPWHPFELNADLTLESLVDDGYSFAGAPCMQVQYVKQIGDTMIQYEVEVDCKSYVGRYDPYESLRELETEFQVEDTATVVLAAEGAEKEFDEIESNIYYPWDLDSIENCYQNIRWRVFEIELGETLDSAFVENYVRQKGGYIVEHASTWDSKNGGHLLVSYSPSRLLFLCDIGKQQYEEFGPFIWTFRIVSYIPELDQVKTGLEKQHAEKKRMYYAQ